MCILASLAGILHTFDFSIFTEASRFTNSCKEVATDFRSIQPTGNWKRRVCSLHGCFDVPVLRTQERFLLGTKTKLDAKNDTLMNPGTYCHCFETANLALMPFMTVCCDHIREGEIFSKSWSPLSTCLWLYKRTEDGRFVNSWRVKWHKIGWISSAANACTS